MSENARDVRLLLRAQVGLVKALALKFAPLPGVADDIAQQVFLEFLAKQEEWDLSSDLKPLLAAMTRTIALRYWRARAQALDTEGRQLAEYVRELSEREETAVFGVPERVALRHCIEQLPDRGRALVTQHYLEGHSSVALAQRLGMTAAAVRRALFRLRAQLRKCLENSLPGGAPDA